MDASLPGSVLARIYQPKCTRLLIASPYAQGGCWSIPHACCCPHPTACLCTEQPAGSFPLSCGTSPVPKRHSHWPRHSSLTPKSGKLRRDKFAKVLCNGAFAELLLLHEKQGAPQNPSFPARHRVPEPGSHLGSRLLASS